MKSFLSLSLCLTFFATLPLCVAKNDDAPIVAVYDIESAISESGQQQGGLLGLGGLTGGANRPLTHFDIIRSLKAAAEDKNVKGVVLDLGGAGIDFAQLQEMRRCLLAIRKVGKDVWFYTESISNGTALIGSAANHFTLLPEGDVSFSGMYSESMYFKGLLDKVGVQVDVIHIGDFKSAGETFYRTGPSEHAKKQSDILYASIFNQIITLVAEGRKMTPEAVRALIDEDLVTPERAKEAGLVDHLQYRTDFIKTVRSHYQKDGEKIEFDREYALPNLDGPEIDGLMDIMKLAFQSGKSKKHKTDYIAVIALDGEINDASIAPVRKEVLKVAKDDKCKALILRVNSPGGSALSSDVLWEATDEFKTTGKPFVVSMGAVAASGGYYVSAGASRIFAEQGTITGSIGVVGMKFVYGTALAKLGVTVHSSQHGKHAGMQSSTRPFSPAEAAVIRKSMLDVYGTFKKRITDGRGDRIKGDLENLAGGRVYSGTDALKVGLVDEIGGLNEAIAHAAKLAKLETYEAHLTPAPKSGLDGMFSEPHKDEDDEEFIRMSRPKQPSSLLTHFISNSPELRLLGPAKLAEIQNFIKSVTSYQNNKILLIGPDIQMPGL